MKKFKPIIPKENEVVEVKWIWNWETDKVKRTIKRNKGERE